MVGTNRAQPGIDGERHLDDFVKDRLVAGCAEATAIFGPRNRPQGGIRVKHAAAAWAENVPVQIKQPEPGRLQQACDDAFFVKLRMAGEIDRVDAAERLIRRVRDQLVDRIDHIRVGDLSQRREESLGLAHMREDTTWQGFREGRSLLCHTAPPKPGSGLAAARWSAAPTPGQTSLRQTGWLAVWEKPTAPWLRNP